jgi:hypothetical protein
MGEEEQEITPDHFKEHDGPVHPLFIVQQLAKIRNNFGQGLMHLITAMLEASPKNVK